MKIKSDKIDSDLLKDSNEPLEKKNSKSTPTENNRFIVTSTIDNQDNEKFSLVKNKIKSNKLQSDKTNLKEVRLKNVDANIFRKSLNFQDPTINNKNLKINKENKKLKEENDDIFYKINETLKGKNTKTNQISLKKNSESPAFLSPKFKKIDSSNKLKLNFLKSKNNQLGKSLKLKEKDSVTSPNSILSVGSPKNNKPVLANTERKINMKNNIEFKDLNNSNKFEHNRHLLNEISSPKS